MYGREKRVLLREYLEQGLTKTVLAVKLGSGLVWQTRPLPKAWAQPPYDPSLDRNGAAGSGSGQRGGALQEAPFDAA